MIRFLGGVALFGDDSNPPSEPVGSLRMLKTRRLHSTPINLKGILIGFIDLKIF